MPGSVGDVVCFAPRSGSAPIRVFVFNTAKQNGLRGGNSSRFGGGDGGESDSLIAPFRSYRDGVLRLVKDLGGSALSNITSSD